MSMKQVVSLVVVVGAVLAASCAVVYNRKTAGDCPVWVSGWNATRGRLVSSVAWSPDGKMIAFLATARTEAKEGPLLHSEIWLLRPSARQGDTQVRRLFRWSGKSNPWPSHVFWISSTELAWAGGLGKEKWLSFFAGDINSRRMHRFVRDGFSLYQTMQIDRGGVNPGLDDVHWDAVSRKLYFSGTAFGPGIYGATVYSYDTQDRLVNVMPFDGEFVSIAGGDSSDSLFYSTWDGKASQVWRGDCAVVVPGAEPIAATRKANVRMLYLRAVPHSKRLSWLETPNIDVSGADMSRGSIAVFDPRTSDTTVITDLDLQNWVEMGSPGCPFSWSPDGQRIAYADGSRIEIIRVPANIASRK